MIISKDFLKAFDKIQYALTIEILESGGLEGTYLNIINADMTNP